MRGANTAVKRNDMEKKQSFYVKKQHDVALGYLYLMYWQSKPSRHTTKRKRQGRCVVCNRIHRLCHSQHVNTTVWNTEKDGRTQQRLKPYQTLWWYVYQHASILPVVVEYIITDPKRVLFYMYISLRTLRKGIVHLKNLLFLITRKPLSS